MNFMLVVPIVVMQACLPGVLLVMTRGGNGRVGSGLAAFTRVGLGAYVALTSIIELGAVSLLEATASGPMHCGTGFAGLLMLMFAMVPVSAVTAVLFSFSFVSFVQSADGPGRRSWRRAIGLFLCGLLLGVVLFSTWAAPFFFVGHLALGLLAVLLTGVSTWLTGALVWRATEPALTP